MEGDGYVAVRNAIHRLRVTHPGFCGGGLRLRVSGWRGPFSSELSGDMGGDVYRKELVMMIILLVLLLAVILAGLGFAVHLLWWIALIVLAMWLVGFLVRTTEAAGRRRRWYR